MCGYLDELCPLRGSWVCVRLSARVLARSHVLMFKARVIGKWPFSCSTHVRSESDTVGTHSERRANVNAPRNQRNSAAVQTWYRGQHRKAQNKVRNDQRNSHMCTHTESRAK
jgi:hypothetical protein